MSISHVSNVSIYNNLRTTVQRVRTEIVQREQEAVTGRHANVNLALGHKAGVPVALRVELDRLQSIVSENALVTQKLDMTQGALGNLVSANQLVIDGLVTAIGSQDSVAVAIEQARTTMAQFTATMNTSDGGQYLFAGINTDVRPLDDFLAQPAGAARTAFEAAFNGEFGFAPGDPAAATIDPASMEAFLDGAFEQLFEDPQWQANWSAASDRNIRNRISPQMVVETRGEFQ
jgi:flagellar hook-associated protein 3 FlgL